MRRVHFFNILIVLLLSHNVMAQQDVVAKVSMETVPAKSNEIVYHKGLQLKLSDFQGSFEPGSDAVAMTYSGVSLKYSGSVKKGQLELNIKLYVSFDKARSWCLEKSRNEWTLAHEQRHFDITVISACALYKAIQNYHFTKNFEREIYELQQKFKTQNEEEQDVYDVESNHGINKEGQEAWNKKLSKSLAKSSDCFE